MWLYLEEGRSPAKKRGKDEKSLMVAQTGFIPCGHNVMLLQITSYYECCLKGILTSALFDGELVFQSAIELLCWLESLMDQVKFPQRNEEPRVFQSVAQPAGEKIRRAAREKAPVSARFQLNVMFRQNATWQGSLLWVDRGIEAHFRSVLELLNLLNSALSSEAGETA